MPARPRPARRTALVIATGAALAVGGLALVPASATAIGPPTCATSGITIIALHGPTFYIDPGTSPALTSAYAGYRVTNVTGSALTDTWVQLSGFTGGSVALGSGQPAAAQIPTLGNSASKALFWYLTASAETVAAQGHTITVFTHRPDLANATVLCTASGGFGSVASTIAASANKITSVALSTQTPSIGKTFSVVVDGTSGNIGGGPAADPGSFWMSPSSTSGWPAAAYRLVSTSLLISPDGSGAQQPYSDLLHLSNLGSTARPYTATYTFQAAGFTASDATLQPAQQIASGTQIKHTGSYPATIPAIHPASNTLAVALAGTPSRLNTGGGTVSYTATLAGTSGASVDSFTVALPAGSSIVPNSAAYDSTPVSDPSSNGTALVFQGPFTLGASSAALTFQVAFGGTTGSRSVAATASVGSAVIDTTPNTLTDNVPAAATVTVNTAPVATDDAPSVPQNATATVVDVLGNDTDADSDSLTVTGVGPAGHGTAALSGGVVRYTPTVGYSGADTLTYTISDGHGGTASATVHVGVVALIAQTIAFTQPADIPVTSTPVTLGATATSGLPVSFSTTTPGVCAVDGGTGVVTPHAVGTCTVSVDQPGSGSFAAAAIVQKSFQVTRAAQAITFVQPADVSVSQTGVVMSAVASSGGAIAWSSSTGEVCTVDAGSGAVTNYTFGVCTISADQPGSSAYTAAPTVTRSFLVTDTPALTEQTITFPPPADVYVDATGMNASASADSGLDIAFDSTTAEVCTVDAANGAITLLTTGTCTITASQPGNGTYAAASPVTHSFVVAPEPQTITFVQPAPVTLPTAGLTLSGSTTSGLTVGWTSGANAVCTVDASGVVTFVAAGDCVVTAAQSGNGIYSAAPPVSRTFAVTRSPQAITTGTPHDSRVSDGPVVITASADSGLAVTFRTTTPKVCTVDADGTVGLVAAGACSIVVEQAGDTDYVPASSPVDFTVLADPVAQSLTFPAPDDVVVTSGTVTVAATASSGLTPTYNSLTAAVCAVDAAGTVTLYQVGTCTVRADQAGNGTYAAATPATATFLLVAAPQSIVFPQPTDTVATATGTTVAATATSGLPTTYSSATTDVCTVDNDGDITLHAAGTCTVTAHQTGNATYEAADDLTRSFTVALTTQTITAPIPTVLDVTQGPTGFPSISSSGQPLTVTAGPVDVCTATILAGRVTLVPVGAGSCAVTLTAPGTTVYEPATRTYPVTVTATVTDDVYTVAPVSSGGVGVVLHVLANDTPGMTLTSVTQPPHGRVTVSGDTLTFTPTVAFKGTETFSYTTTDGDGGRHVATVTITVPDTAPVVRPGATTTIAGRTGIVTLTPTDVNGDRVRLTAGPVAGALVRVSGHLLVVRPSRSFSGVLRIPVTADDGDGGITHTVASVRVNPLPATRATRTLSQAGTRLHWETSPAADARYEIRYNGVTVCVTTQTSCTIGSLIGPRARVVVIVLGHQRTRSALTVAVPRSGVAVRVGTVYFATASAWVSPRERAVARAIKSRLYRAGFASLDLIGFTDSRGSVTYNVDLSRRRARAVQRWLGYGAHISVRSSWRGKSDPARSNRTALGMALNRRVEVWIR